MSMDKALAALNTPNNAEIPTTPTETPINLANNGANLTDKSLPNQPAQETKVTATTGDQSIEAKKDGVVDADKSTEATTSTAPKKEEETPISSKFAALAKKEKALVKQQADIKAKEATFSQREAAIAEREAKIKESESLWETDVLKALEMKGYTYQKLTDMILNGKATIEKAPEDPAALAKRLTDEVRKEFADKEAAREAAIKKSQEDEKAAKAKELEEATEAYRQQVINFTKENENEYELINMYGQQELVLGTVEAFYEKHNRVLSIKEASDMTEKYLTDEAERAVNSKKFANRLAPKKETPADKVIKTETAKSAPTKTLTNNLTPTMASVLPAATDAERMKRALNKLNENQR